MKVRLPVAEIQVVVVNDGRGICAVCGNGLWPGQEPCEHKKALSDEEMRGS